MCLLLLECQTSRQVDIFYRIGGIYLCVLVGLIIIVNKLDTYILSDEYCSRISLLCLTIYAVTAVPIDEQQNKPRISEEDLEIALKDNRYIKKQLTCALDNIKCDSVGRRLKSLAPLVLRGNCPQCSPDEIVYIRKVLLHVQSQFPQEWSRLLQKYSKF